MDKPGFYRTIWRWHFYAGLFVIPFILILSVTGAAYLFKPQVERWEEQPFLELGTVGAVAPTAQADAALAAFPGARLMSYRLPRADGDAAMLTLALSDNGGTREVFVAPQGTVLGSFQPDGRVMALMHRIHGTLLLGERGSWLVELAASWAIVMILTGLYLWWPRGQGLAGVVYPRLSRKSRGFWRDLHAVTGFWVSSLALVLLVTGLPWAAAWGSALKSVRSELGLIKGAQDWTIGGKPASHATQPPRTTAATDEHAGHGAHTHDQSAVAPDAASANAGLSAAVAIARQQALAFPALVVPPGAPQRFGVKDSPHWTLKSDAQNRPLRTVIRYDATTDKIVSRDDFKDRHVIDRAIGYGIAWHEGQLFGWINQLIGVLTALALLTLAISGFIMWRRRKPEDLLGAPLVPEVPVRIRGVTAIMLVLAVLLPLFAASLIGLALVERLVLPRLPRMARWLGMASVAARA